MPALRLLGADAAIWAAIRNSSPPPKFEDSLTKVGRLPAVGPNLTVGFVGAQRGEAYQGNPTTSARIRKALDAVVSPKQKLTKTIRKPKATWVEPEFYADVECRDITSPRSPARQLVQRLIKGTRRS